MDGELKRIISEHIARYPLMRAQDLYKLVYQHEFGCAHAVADRETAKARLAEEYRSVEQKEAPLAEELGNGYVRVHLSALDSNGVDPEEVSDWFVKSASPAGDREHFKRLLMELESLDLPFDPEELEGFFRAREEEGFPAVHHSPEYREAYRPAYRVVKSEYVRQKR